MDSLLQILAGAMAGKVEVHGALARLGEEYSERYPEDAAVYYRQGFTDAMRLVFDCLPRKEKAKKRKGDE